MWNMGFRIVEIEELSGPACKIYSIAYDSDKGDTLLDEFLDRMDAEYPAEVDELWARFVFMGREDIISGKRKNIENEAAN